MGGTSNGDDIGDGADALAPAGGTHRRADFVVAVGSSAGGLEALQEFLPHLPVAGLAVVVAQHMSPEHRSLIVELLERRTPLRVVEASDGAALVEGTVYICPPNHDLTIDEAVIHVEDPSPSRVPHPNIDLLFESVALHWGRRGVGVVLSGTGADGSSGLRSINAAGGLTIAQRPESAKFGSMPYSAIELGAVDIVLDAAEMGPLLRRLADAEPLWTGADDPDLEDTTVRRIVATLRRMTGIDFSRYKDTTLRRQIARRMAVRQLTGVEDYLPLLTAEQPEAQALMVNLLVTVTSFFRDEAAFAALGAQLTRYAHERDEDTQLRMWVPGCATGEEVYSIAMLVAEALGRPTDLLRHLKIFATDLDDASLAVARRAVYPLAAAERVPEHLRARYMLDTPFGAEIVAEIRDCIVFARHNLAEDPPFPRLDLISCRNTLIYFTTPLQDKVIDLMRYALEPAGLLFLGASEAPGSSATGFVTLDAANRIYVRTGERSVMRERTPSTLAWRPPNAPARTRQISRPPLADHRVTLLEALFRTIGDPCLVLDDDDNVLEVVGDVSRYCQVPSGPLSAAAIPLLAPELRGDARHLLLQLRAGPGPIAGRSIALANAPGGVLMTVRSMLVESQQRRVLSFVALPDVDRETPPEVTSGTEATPEQAIAFDRELQRLESELSASQETLRISIEELEATNEELQASSEELQATNEELQSSYEELETSNEELHATNEELGTLNAKLRSRSGELTGLNTDLENILSSLNQGMVQVDQNLRVTRFSPLAVRLFALMDSDVGQPLLGIPTTMTVAGFDQALHAVVGGASRRSLEAHGDGGAFLVQVLPYITEDSERRGAIITLTDISFLATPYRATESELRGFQRGTDVLPELVWKRDATSREVLYTSRRIEEFIGYTQQDLGRDPSLLDAAIAVEDRERVEAARAVGAHNWSVDYRLENRDGGSRWVREGATLVPDPGGDFIFGTLIDITDDVELRQRAEQQAAVFESVFHTAVLGVAVLDSAQRIVIANDAFCSLVGIEPGALDHRPIASFLHPGDDTGMEEFTAQIARSIAIGEPTIRRLADRGEESRWVMCDIRPLRQAMGDYAAILIMEDVTAVQENTAALAHQANFDAGSGLVNRSFFGTNLEREIARARREGGPLALAWIDLDSFKEVNDQYGHDVGDTVLRSVAERLVEAVRREDVVGRLGGDEFGIILTEFEHLSGLESVMDRLQQALARPVHVDGAEIVQGASIGVALFPRDGEGQESLMRSADTAMYAAKAAGGGHFEYFEAAMNLASEERRRLRHGITAAVRQGDFELHYQPILDLSNHSVWGVEALIRGVRDGVLVDAKEFIPFCEETGLIRPLGHLSMALLRADLQRLRAAGHPRMPVSFNMGVAQLEDPRLVSLLEEWPGPHGLEGIMVEITESVFLPGHARAMVTVDAIRALGGSLAVDDFGSGFSNLRLLESLSPSVIKLDSSLLAVSDPGSQDALLRAAIELAHAMGATVVAEGIETPERLALVNALGADLGQGYLLGPPMPLAELLAWMADRTGSPDT